MNTMKIHRTGIMAGAVVAIAVQVLPSAHRVRYSDEFRADLSVLKQGHQLPYAFGALVSAIPLRRAVKAGSDGAARSVVYWKCRWGRHRWMVVNDDNPEQRKGTHKECSRCLKLKDINEHDPTSGAWMARVGGWG